MWIKSILSPELTLAKQELVSKKRVLDTVAELFASAVDGIDAADLFMHIVSREKLGSTGIGAGIAIPHCRFPTDGETMCACITLAQPIDFDAVDQKPVDLIFAMVVPEDAESDHLQRLAALAEALQQQSYTESLRAAQNSEELYAAAIQE